MTDTVPITPGAGVSIATDDVGGVQFQRVKLTFGIDGTATDVSAVDPLPVTGAFYPATQPVSGTVGISGTVPVSGTFFQVTQPVSIASMPSTPVTGTFWQSSQPVSIAATVAVSGPVTDAQLRASAVPVSLASMPSTPVTGTFWQATQPVSGTFWQATQPVSGTVTANAGTGTFAVSGTFWQATQPVSFTQPALVAGSAIIGKVGIDQTTVGTTNAVSLAQIGANTVLTGNGVTGTGSPRVTIASDQTAFSVNAVQSGTWTVQPGNTANTTPWLVKPHDGTNAGTIKAASTAAAFTDTALVVDPRPGGALVTASAAMADALANPTIGVQATLNSLFNGTTWDRQRGIGGNSTTGDTGAKTATGNGATQTNVGNKGVQILFVFGTVSGTSPTFVGKVQGSVDGGTTWYDIPGAATASLTATGNFGILIYPGIAVTAGTTTTGTTATANMTLPRTWRVVWTIGGTTPSFTITNVQFNYLMN